jgi:hypothetical protein
MSYEPPDRRTTLPLRYVVPYVRRKRITKNACRRRQSSQCDIARGQWRGGTKRRKKTKNLNRPLPLASIVVYYSIHPSSLKNGYLEDHGGSIACSRTARSTAWKVQNGSRIDALQVSRKDSCGTWTLSVNCRCYTCCTNCL